MAEERIDHLMKSWGPTRGLDDVAPSFPDGGFFGLLGPPGSGKTTLLRAIAGFVIPDAGGVFIGEPPVEHTPVEARENRTNCLAGSASGWRWRARLSRGQGCFCSMSRFPRWINPRGWICRSS